MSEELLQRNLVKNPEKIGKWDFYSIGATTVKALKEYGIIRNVDYGDVEKKKIDALIVQNKNVIAVIEYKKPSEFRTKEQKTKAIKQEIEVAQKLGSKIFIASRGSFSGSKRPIQRIILPGCGCLSTFRNFDM